MREFPHRERFEVDGIYLNSAATHPMSIASADAIKRYMADRMCDGTVSGYDIVDERNDAKALFARLINCEADELAWVPSTMVGENLILAGLGLPEKGAHIVTDAAHFQGSLYLYQSLQEEGVEVTILPLQDNGVRPERIDAAIRPNTKLVALSQVSALNGFEHDLQAVCAVAHARGVPVYADIIQAVGAMPVDVRASGVDFCACSTYKWLMGDFGVGFLYIRGDRIGAMRRTQRGYRQLLSFGTHFLPYEPPHEQAVSFVRGADASALFEVGTLGYAAVAALKVSLSYLLETGVAALQAYRRPMMARLQDALPSLGFEALTPRTSDGPIVSFAFENAMALKPVLEAAGIQVQLYPHRFRISPSMFNSMDDIESLIDVLRKFQQKAFHA
jgi:selenocysteine lyase/cysteine desulfurase